MTTWLEDIVTAFNNLDGVSHYEELYEEVKELELNHYQTPGEAL